MKRLIFLCALLAAGCSAPQSPAPPVAANRQNSENLITLAGDALKEVSTFQYQMVLSGGYLGCELSSTDQIKWDKKAKHAEIINRSVVSFFNKPAGEGSGQCRMTNTDQPDSVEVLDERTQTWQKKSIPAVHLYLALADPLSLLKQAQSTSIQPNGMIAFKGVKAKDVPGLLPGLEPLAKELQQVLSLELALDQVVLKGELTIDQKDNLPRLLTLKTDRNETGFYSVEGQVLDGMTISVRYDAFNLPIEFSK